MAEPTEPIMNARLEAISGAARTIQRAARQAIESRFSATASVRQVGKTLGIGPFLAWKLLRLARADDIAEILESIPGQRGRNSIVASVRDRLNQPEAAAALDRAFDAYLDLVETLGFHKQELAITVGADHEHPTSHEAAERTASQMMSRYAELRGHRIDLLLGGTLAYPSRDHPGRFDVAFYELCHGLTRLRPGGPILVHSQTDIEDETERDRSSIAANLVPAASTPDLEDEEIVVTSVDDTIAVYADPRPDRLEPITLGFLQIVPNMGAILQPAALTRPRERWYDSSSSPARQAVVEYFQPADLPGPTAAHAVSEFMSFTGPATTTGSNGDRVPLPTPVTWCETPVLPEIQASAAPFHRALLEAALAGTGLTPDDLRGVRTVMADPPPGSRLTLYHFPAVADADEA